MTQSVNAEADGQYHKAYRHIDNMSAAAAITDAGAVTYTAAQILGGFILRDCSGGGRSDVLPTAALLVAALRGEKIGDIIKCLVMNNSDADEVITITPGTNGTIPQVDGTQIIPQNTSRMLYIRLTGVVAGSEAYVVYM